MTTTFSDWPVANTEHGLLVAFGEFMQQHGLIERLMQVPVKQKMRSFAPQTKLVELLAGVSANGGLGALIAKASVFFPAPWWWAAFVGTLASVNADTWATELGVLSPKPPRLATTGRTVEIGTSGGISSGGTGAALAGGGFIVLFAGALTLGTEGVHSAEAVLLAGSIGGLIGSLFDSLLGATVQQVYVCDHCRKETERMVHRCGNTTRRLRGWRWLTNDGVNFLSSGVGAIASVILWVALIGSRSQRPDCKNVQPALS